jgi:hypothetical protein
VGAEEVDDDSLAVGGLHWFSVVVVSV